MKINNNIEEQYCSFNISKLLKEKGFEVKGMFFFNEGSGWKKQSDNLLRIYENLIENPTHSIVISWIRVNFGIHIYSLEQDKFPKSVKERYMYQVINTKVKGKKLFANKNYFIESNYIFSSYEQATESALEYVLTNLI